MPNMSYCRFANTLDDLQDCWENFDDDLSEAEAKARKKLIKLCIQIAAEAEYFIEEEENVF